MEAGVHGSFTHDASGAFQMCNPAAIGDPGMMGADSQAGKRSFSNPKAQPQTDAERLAVEANRAQKVKEKNKRAQQRFRERQKAKSCETQSEVARLKMQVSTLQAQLAEAEHSRRLLGQGPLACQAGPSLGLAAFSAGVKPEDLPYSGEGEAAAHLEPRNGWVSLRQDTVLLLALAKQGPMRLGADDLRLRSPEQHDQFWRGYVEQLAMALVEMQNAQEGAEVRCTELVNELTCYVCMMVLVNPRVVLSCMAADQDEGSQGSLHWRAMLKSLGLTEEQKRDLMIARTFVLTSLSSLLQERAQLAASLQEDTGPTSSMRSVCQQQATSAEVSAQLQANIQATSTAFQNFLHIVHKRVLAPVQVATIICQSFPHAVNMLAFVNFLATDLDGPSQNDLLSARPQPHPSLPQQLAPQEIPHQAPSEPLPSPFLGDPRPSSDFWAAMKRG